MKKQKVYPVKFASQLFNRMNPIWNQKFSFRAFTLIDEVRIYEHALTSAQVKKLYAEGAEKKGLLVKIK